MNPTKSNEANKSKNGKDDKEKDLRDKFKNRLARVNRNQLQVYLTFILLFVSINTPIAAAAAVQEKGCFYTIDERGY